MNNMPLDRRTFVQLAAGAVGMAYARPSKAAVEKKKFRLGMCVGIEGDPHESLAKVHELGLHSCQVITGQLSRQAEEALRSALQKYEIEATALTTFGPGEMVWDFLKGPVTIGLVPRGTRQARIDAIKQGSDFAAKLGIPAFQTHCGFIPEFPGDPLYEETVQALTEVVRHCQGNNQWFLCETGQESPVTLLRTIQDTRLDNVGVGLDTANLILYGKGNPVDALDVLGKYVHSVHAKDGFFPTDPNKLGEEVPIGKGKVDFKKVFTRLMELGYTGDITIEREISGPKQMEDIKQSIQYLQGVIQEVLG
ncbi:MAG: sugar phosphate isomerase/epimerase family protein [bacterium]